MHSAERSYVSGIIRFHLIEFVYRAPLTREPAKEPLEKF